MPRDTWFKCDPRAFLDGFLALGSGNEVAVYVAVVFRIYDSGEPVPKDVRSIAAAARVPTHVVGRILTKLVDQGKLVEMRDGRLMNRRADAELYERAKLGDKRAIAGRSGGKATRKQGESRPDADTMQGRSRYDASKKGEETRQSREAIASSRARDNEDKKEESPSPPLEQTGGFGLAVAVPDHVRSTEPLTDEERAAAVGRITSLSTKDDSHGIDVAALTGWIMHTAKMTAPPLDIVLVNSWCLLDGIDEAFIRKIVSRMAGSSRGAIRQMRYFDGEIRRGHEADIAKSSADMRYFDRVIRDHAPPCTTH